MEIFVNIFTEFIIVRQLGAGALNEFIKANKKKYIYKQK